MYEVDVDLCFNVVKEVVSKASEIVLEGHESSLEVMTKTSKFDLVTIYDKRTEEFLIKALKDAFPDHKFIGEETTANNKLTEEPTWIIDPIDGTTNYIHGYPHIGISLALAVNKEIIIGIVSNPLLKQTFTAVKGRGAFLNEKQIHASKSTELQSSLIGLEVSVGSIPKYTEEYCQKYKNIVTQIQGVRSLGSAELGLCMVGWGVWDGYHVNHLQSWDVAAGSLIITEAGGCVLGVDGGKFNCETGGIIAAGTEKLCKLLVELLNCK
ncbi:inositol monophosphatase 2-like [Cimex lectularius]|uniref:Inositol-1-monophosphatase n=1 Tax=Cimex lectularius TaxID=79782 RepID=A0A8I6S4F0_CIMLE|nr:inositol monophosphatase 2-like [Cimex lectularius]